MGELQTSPRVAAAHAALAEAEAAKAELDRATRSHRFWWRTAVCSSLAGVALSTCSVVQALSTGRAIGVAVNGCTLIVGVGCLVVLARCRPRRILRMSISEAQAVVTLIVFFGRFRRRPKRGG